MVVVEGMVGKKPGVILGKQVAKDSFSRDFSPRWLAKYT